MSTDYPEAPHFHSNNAAIVHTLTYCSPDAKRLFEKAQPALYPSLYLKYALLNNTNVSKALHPKVSIVYRIKNAL